MSEMVAVIGMGQMGSGMAGRLKESGLDVVGYDVSTEQRTRLVKDGFQMTSNIAEALAAKAIVVPTFTGRTASAVARLRPRRPIIGCTHHTYSLRHMALEWGVLPMRVPEASDVEDIWGRSLDAARNSGLVQPGDRVVITAGTAVNIPGSTNVIKVDIV